MRVTEESPGRALPAHVVAQLDAHLDLLAAVPGLLGPARASPPSVRSANRPGHIAVLAYQLLKGTGRRVGEVASLHLECLDVDEHGKDVLVYDNHKAGRLGRRLPLADPALVTAIRAQQTWVTGRFPDTPADRLWLLPRPHKNVDGTHHLAGDQLLTWIRTWVDRIPRLDAGPRDQHGEPVPFARAAIHPHAFRHTYAQTLADQGVAPSVLRDLMDHRSLTATLGYYRVGDARKREAMDALARHAVDNLGVTRPADAQAPRSPACANSCPGSRCRWASAPNRPTCAPAASPARSATSAPAAHTSSPTRPTCPSCAATPTTCAANARRCSPPAPRTGPSTA